MAPPPPATTGLRPLVPLGGGEGGEREGEGGGGGARVAPRTPAGASREGRGGLEVLELALVKAYREAPIVKPWSSEASRSMVVCTTLILKFVY